MPILENPAAFWWLIPSLCLGILWIKTPLFVTAKGKRVLLWVKVAILCLLILAMADPRWEIRSVSEKKSLVFALDISPSIPRSSYAEIVTKIKATAQTAGEDVDIQWVVFDGESALVEGEKRTELSRAPEKSDTIIKKSYQKEAETDIGGALERSLKCISPGTQGHIVLFSDGRDTVGNVPSALERLSETNVPVTTVMLETAELAAHPKIVRTVFPEQVFVKEEVKGSVLVWHPAGGEVTIDLSGSDGVQIPSRVNVDAGYTSFPFTFQANKPGAHVYTLAVGNEGAPAAVSRSFSVLRVKSNPKVLIFQESEAEGAFLAEALRQENIEFSAFSKGHFPPRFDEALKEHAAVILHSVPAAAFSKEQLKSLRTMVYEGGGLFMLGGPNSYGLGEYTDTPIEECLPVSMPRRTINEPLGLVLVLDCSGSMAGQPWLYLIEATKEIVRLCKGHYVGIILFNHMPVWIYPIQQIRDPEGLCQMLDQYEPGGGTVFSLPLAQAFVGIRDLPFSRKTVLMMSDGVPADFGHVVPLMETFREAKVQVTTIAAGNDVNPGNLQFIAQETGGEYYESPDFAELPNLFKKEFKRLSGPPFIQETFQPILADSSILAKGISPQEIPTIDGLVVTQGKKGANLVMISNRGDPVLAFWRFGLGRSAAFTPDLLPHWTKRWTKWPGFGKLLRQTVKELCEGSREKFALFADQKGRRVSLLLEPGEGKKTFEHVVLTAGAFPKKTVSLVPLPDGRFEGEFEAPGPGVYTCKVYAPGASLVGEAPLTVHETREFMPGKANRPLLQEIAEKTGGEFVPGLANNLAIAFEGQGATRIFFPLWPYVAFFALFLYLIDIYLRKAGVFAVSSQTEIEDAGGVATPDMYMQLATKFSNMAEEHSLKGEVDEAKRYFLRAKAFFLKAQATKEANVMWERYKRFESR